MKKINKLPKHKTTDPKCAYDCAHLQYTIQHSLPSYPPKFQGVNTNRITY